MFEVACLRRILLCCSTLLLCPQCWAVSSDASGVPHHHRSHKQRTVVRREEQLSSSFGPEHDDVAASIREASQEVPLPYSLDAAPAASAPAAPPPAHHHRHVEAKTRSLLDSKRVLLMEGGGHQGEHSIIGDHRAHPHGKKGNYTQSFGDFLNEEHRKLLLAQGPPPPPADMGKPGHKGRPGVIGPNGTMGANGSIGPNGDKGYQGISAPTAFPSGCITVYMAVLVFMVNLCCTWCCYCSLRMTAVHYERKRAHDALQKAHGHEDGHHGEHGVHHIESHGAHSDHHHSHPEHHHGAEVHRQKDTDGHHLQRQHSNK